MTILFLAVALSAAPARLGPLPALAPSVIARAPARVSPPRRAPLLSGFALAAAALTGCASAPIHDFQPPLPTAGVPASPGSRIAARVEGSGKTAAMARRLIAAVLSRARPGLAESLDRRGLRVIILEDGAGFDEVEPFKSAIARQVWGLDQADPRPRLISSDGMTLGGSVIGVREAARRSKDHIVLHELGHAVFHVLSPSEQAEVRRLFGEAKKDRWVLGIFTHDGFIDAEARKDPLEYFAQAVPLYFDVFSPPATFSAGPKWLRENDPGLFNLLSTVFGPPL